MVIAASLKVGDRGLKLHSDLQVSKKQNVSSPLPRNDSILRGTSVTERQRARPQTVRARLLNSLSKWQCHLILTRWVEGCRHVLSYIFSYFFYQRH